MKGAREFLASKELAMMEMKLCDEIIEINNNTKEFIDKKNFQKRGRTNIMKRTISPKKSKKSYKNNDLIMKKSISVKKSKKYRKKSKFYINSKSNNDIENNIIFNKEDNEGIYKFFVENANDEEEIFQQKLKKELEKLNKEKKR